MERKADFSVQESLTEIAESFRKVKIALAKQRTGDYSILWGLVMFLGYTATEIFNNMSMYENVVLIWLTLIVIGITGTVIITIKRIKQGTSGYFPEGAYIVLSWSSLLIYALILLGIFKITGISLQGIQVSLFLLNFAMLGYVLMGIFLGKELAIIGIGTSIASLFCVLFLKEFFNIAMALLSLFSFVGGGIYINKKWSVKNESRT
ncbi:MAG: hypothetical protein RMJ81_04075 [Candidatus Kryptonium sp.]|nr:hypothetical protein [Candidatus Kryptonium sp.]MCX7761851.1 hypothetical protein [Candidatus Kryptonium sp.]MDW8108817.1 hypothetical protein [Candidatus Kryptonium sp.]